MKPVSIEGNDFVRDGAPHRILAGALHYFRVVPEYWHDRLLKLGACGLNTVETYVSWNLHEPSPGQFRFEGMLDIERFLRTAGELGLDAIVRPGPYICSEWDLGGLPAWLLADGNMRLRCAYPPYLEAVDRYLDALMERLVPLQASRGGPIVAMQVENEYGSYGNDRTYLRHLADGLRARGFEGLLFTSDGACDWMLEGGTLPEVHKVANFGSGATASFAKLREHQPEGPLMCGEFWCGWFDHWGETHHTRPAEDAAAALDEVLANGASVSIYMFHGGTNFGFLNGANHGNGYEPTVSSYDSDAPLDECGDPTAKYHAFREVIARYAPIPDGPLPPPVAKASYGAVELTERCSLWDALPFISSPLAMAAPAPMETWGQDYGFVLYRTEVHGPREEQPVELQEVHDRALVFADGELLGVAYRNGPNESLRVGVPAGASLTLGVLVENMGRVNYGPRLHDRKGITEGIRLGQQFLYGWTAFPLPLEDLTAVPFEAREGLEGPAFYRGHFEVETPADTWLALPGWTKGVAFVNGFALGRYWEEKGPQRTLYVPAPLLRKGPNELVVFELHRMETRVAHLRDTPDLG